MNYDAVVLRAQIISLGEVGTHYFVDPGSCKSLDVEQILADRKLETLQTTPRNPSWKTCVDSDGEQVPRSFSDKNVTSA